MADVGASEDAYALAQLVARRSYGRLLAFVAARTRDIAAAEDALGDAFAAALAHWPVDGVPANPEAWLLTAARHRALDGVRRQATQAAASDELMALAQPGHAEHADLAALNADKMSTLIVCNKMDRFPQFNPKWLLNPNDANILDFYRGQEAPLSKIVPLIDKQVITASAKNHQNIDWLKENLLNTVVDGGLNLEHTVVSNARHFEALQKSHDSLTDVLRSLDNGVTTDFVAMDIRRALNHLGEITGEVGVEDLLDNIFSKFCIGK